MSTSRERMFNRCNCFVARYVTKRGLNPVTPIIVNDSLGGYGRRPDLKSQPPRELLARPLLLVKKFFQKPLRGGVDAVVCFTQSMFRAALKAPAQFVFHPA
jgi:hypothetical protein